MTTGPSNLTALLDRLDMEKVATSYALALDSRDWDRLRHCFTSPSWGAS